MNVFFEKGRTIAAVLALMGLAAIVDSCAELGPPLPALPSPQFEDGPMIAQADLVADFDAWMSGMRALSPDLSIRSDMQVLQRQAAQIRQGLNRPMSRRQAWEQFARLNPVLNDGHNAIYMPDYRGALEAHLKSGGHIVPLEVRFAPDKSLRVFSVAPGSQTVKPGDRLLSINGHSAEAMTEAMLALSPGDTPAYRRAWAVRRFAMLYWYLYGDTGQYDIEVQSGRSPVRARLEGGTTLPEALQSRPKSADLFAWRILPGDIGYLRVDSFDPGEAEALSGVAHAAFAKFKQAGIKALIIDIRENGGGDDPLWQQNLMEYITSKPYAQLSRYAIRVTKNNAGPGDVVGDVQRAEYTKRFTPQPVEPLRFNGPVYILPGPYSFSAAIQFTVAAQDFGIAKIAGEETAALSCQTGKYEQIALPKTGLAAFTPTIAYTRPSGRGCKHGVIPDVPIAINEVMPDETLDQLASWIRTHPAAP